MERVGETVDETVDDALPDPLLPPEGSVPDLAAMAMARHAIRTTLILTMIEDCMILMLQGLVSCFAAAVLVRRVCVCVKMVK